MVHYYHKGVEAPRESPEKGVYNTMAILIGLVLGIILGVLLIVTLPGGV
jgi:hypothetical protein